MSPVNRFYQRKAPPLRLNLTNKSESKYVRIPEEQITESFVFSVPWPLVGYDKEGDYYTNQVELLDSKWRLVIRGMEGEDYLSILLLHEGDKTMKIKYVFTLLSPSPEAFQHISSSFHSESKEEVLENSSQEHKEIDDKIDSKEALNSQSLRKDENENKLEYNNNNNDEKNSQNTDGKNDEKSNKYDNKLEDKLGNIEINDSKFEENNYDPTPRALSDLSWTDPEGFILFSSYKESNNLWGCDDFLPLSNLRSFLFYSSTSTNIQSSTLKIRLDLYCLLSILEYQEKLHDDKFNKNFSLTSIVDPHDLALAEADAAASAAAGEDNSSYATLNSTSLSSTTTLKKNNTEQIKAKIETIVRIRGKVEVEEEQDEDLRLAMERVLEEKEKKKKEKQLKKQKEKEKEGNSLQENSFISTTSSLTNISSTTSTPSSSPNRRRKSPLKKRSSSKSPSKKRFSPLNSPKKNEVSSFSYSISSFDL